MRRATFHGVIVFFYVHEMTRFGSSLTFTKCEIARELSQRGFPRHQLEDWVCLIEGESSGRTNVVGGPNLDGSHDHGLFQINDRYWCSNHGHPGKECNARCSDLRSDNIDEAARCAMEIFRRHGFEAWVAWHNECKGRPLPNLRHCGI